MIVADTNISVDLLDTENNMVVGDVNIKDEPERVLPIETINEQVTEKLLGEKLDISLSTKQRGQQLKRMVVYQLGYKRLHEGLEGGYPDIRNQMLEVKVVLCQDLRQLKYLFF